MKNLGLGILVILVVGMLLPCAIGEVSVESDEFHEEQEFLVEPVERAVPEIEEYFLGGEDNGIIADNDEYMISAPEYFVDGDELEVAPAYAQEPEGMAVDAPEADIPIDESHFPDEIFRAYVSDKIDADKDGLLSAAERFGCHGIYVYHTVANDREEITSLSGIEFFPELRYLDCANNKLAELDLSNNPKLESLNCVFTQLTRLDLSSNTCLEELDCSRNTYLTELDLSHNVKLKKLDCRMDKLTHLDVSNNLELEELKCGFWVESNRIESLDIHKNKKLTLLWCDGLGLKELDITNNRGLTSLSCGWNKLTSLDVSNNTMLTNLQISNNNLTSIDITKNTLLDYLEVCNNRLEKLDISKCSELLHAFIAGNAFETLDVSNCPKLRAIVEGQTPRRTNGTSAYQMSCLYYGEIFLRKDSNGVLVENPAYDLGGLMLDDFQAVVIDGKQYGPAHTHTVVTDNAIQATCTTDGKTEGSHCSECGAVLVAQQVIPATGHSPVADYGYAPSCTVDGLTEGSHCSACGAVLVAQQVIPATGHSPVADYGYAATCTTDGLTEGSHCAVCGAVLAAQQVIPATGHSPVYDPGYAPAYGVNGLTDGSHCGVCGAVLAPQQVIPALTYQEVALPNVKNNGAITVNLGEQWLVVPSFAAANGWTVSGYKSSKPAVAYVDGNGLVTASAEGKAKITVTTNEKKKATLTIQVVDPYKPLGIAIAQGKAITIAVGQPLQLNAGLAPETARATLTWTSNKPKVATVDGNGLVMPQGEGKAKITVTTHNKKKATITVQVVDPYKPMGIAIAQGKAITMKAGESLQLVAGMTPDTAQSALTWTSNKPAIASVDGNGVVTAVKKGKAKITVMTYNKKKATITISVVE